MNKLLVTFLLLVGLLSVSTSVDARTVLVKGYYKPSTGAYVMPHYKTTPNKTKIDNFSAKGNYNPYTGKSGEVDPYKS